MTEIKVEAAKKYMESLYWSKPSDGQTESDIIVTYTLGQAKSLAENSFKFGWDARGTVSPSNAEETAEKRKWRRITLCGSTKFKREFEAINRQLTLEGNVVYSVSCFGHADKIMFTDGQKEKLDEVHKRKIDNSEGIFVIDVDGYIGSSTRSEIEYAERTGKFVKYLSDYPDLKWISDSVTAPETAEKLHQNNFLRVLQDNWQAQIAGYYNVDKTDEERKIRKAVIDEYVDLISLYKSYLEKHHPTQKLYGWVKAKPEDFNGMSHKFYRDAKTHECLSAGAAFGFLKRDAIDLVEVLEEYKSSH